MSYPYAPESHRRQATDELEATLRHDLRQPLTVMLTLSELLSMRLAGAGLEADARKADAISAAARRLDAILLKHLGQEPSVSVA